jgi:hypothetical protein
MQQRSGHSYLPLGLHFLPAKTLTEKELFGLGAGLGCLLFDMLSPPW